MLLIQKAIEPNLKQRYQSNKQTKMIEKMIDLYLKHKNSLSFNLTIPLSQSNQDKTKRSVGLKLKGQDQNRTQLSKL